MQFTTVVEATETESFSIKEAVGHQVIVKVIETKTVQTPRNPEPTAPNAVSYEAVDLDAAGGPKVYKDQLVFGDAWVDRLGKLAGGIAVVTVEERKSKTGNKYSVPAPVTDYARATAYYDKAGDPFSGTKAPEATDNVDPWAV